jgi:hypothetical protein
LMIFTDYRFTTLKARFLPNQSPIANPVSMAIGIGTDGY